MVEAPAAASSLSAALYGRGPLLPGSALYTVRLSRAVTAAAASDVGYVEVWDSFRSRGVFRRTSAGASSGALVRRATATLSEVLLPRSALLRSINAGVLSLPYVWCFARHQSIEPVDDQAIVAHRLWDPDRVLDPTLQPPDWTDKRGARPAPTPNPTVGPAASASSSPSPTPGSRGRPNPLGCRRATRCR